MLAQRYWLSDRPPKVDEEPGRVRYEPFFEKMYGPTRDAVRGSTARIRWPPTSNRIRVTTVNGVHEKLALVGCDLNALPRRFKRFLKARPQTFVWRRIRGTNCRSVYSWAIAVDIAIKHSHYWCWSKPNKAGQLPYKNKIPKEIVAAFEKHGFIWGGRWYRYDTMHFEYRPELLLPACM